MVPRHNATMLSSMFHFAVLFVPTVSEEIAVVAERQHRADVPSLRATYLLQILKKLLEVFLVVTIIELPSTTRAFRIV